MYAYKPMKHHIMHIMIKRYLEISGKDIYYIIVGLAAGSIASYYSVYVSEHTGNIMQGDFSTERLKLLFWTSFISIISTSIRGGCFTYSQKCMNHRLRCIIFQKLLHQPPAYYQLTSVSDLLERATNDVRIVSDIISLNINVISRSVINLIVTLYLLMHISYKLTFIAVVLIPVNFLISKVYDKIHQNIMKGFEDDNKLLNTFTHETISHISVVKTFAAENISEKKQNKLSSNIAKYYYKESLLYSFNAFIVFNMPVVITILVILSAKYLDIKEGLVTFILHNQNIYGTIKTIIDFKNEFVRCKEPYERIITILDSQSEEKGYFIPQNDIQGVVTFKSIHFHYNNAIGPILRNLNFHIQAGDRIAIIGPSGCGKSTMAKLLIGILNPANGSILIDSINMKYYDKQWIKRRIGYVAQESILFSDTIANNIAYGLENVSEEDIKNAAKMANADEFISNLPKKYNTVLEGTELSSLSGGQKQRISIARALIRKPKIIIFDEATSALDPYCEEVVQNTIKNCFVSQTASTTMIIIAHRRSALEIADKIYALQDSNLILQLNA